MAGEKGGALEKSLRNIIDYTEEEIKFSGQLKKTLFMPGINLLMIVFVVFFMATVTLPKLEVTLSSLGNGNLPEFSKTVFHISHMIKDNLKTIIVVSSIRDRSARLVDQDTATLYPLRAYHGNDTPL